MKMIKIHGVDIHSKILSSLHNSEENYSYIWIDKEIYEKKVFQNY